MPRLVPGTEPKQRPADQEVKPLAEKQEDTVYHRFHMARVSAELVRPDVSGPKWGLRLGANAGSVFGPCDPDASALHPRLHDELLPQ